MPGSAPRRPARRPRDPGLLPLLLSALVLTPACADGEGPRREARQSAGDAADAPPRVVASIFPVADLARRIGGDAVRIDVLLPPRASPVTFEPTPREVRMVAGASLHLLVGGGLDAWAASLVEGAGNGQAVRLTRGVELVGGDEAPGTGNPHVWLDPILTRDRLVPALVEALAGVVPGARDGLRRRGAALADSLTRLDGWIRGRLEGLESRAFVTTHPAWVYYAGRYGLEEVGSVHGHPGQEPSARALARLVDACRAAGVRAVFSEPQMGAAGARSLARELGVPVLELDPLGGSGVGGRGSYPDLLRFNTLQIARGLGGGGTPDGPDGAAPRNEGG